MNSCNINVKYLLSTGGQRQSARTDAACCLKHTPCMQLPCSAMIETTDRVNSEIDSHSGLVNMLQGRSLTGMCNVLSTHASTLYIQSAMHHYLVGVTFICTISAASLIFSAAATTGSGTPASRTLAVFVSSSLMDINRAAASTL